MFTSRFQGLTILCGNLILFYKDLLVNKEFSLIKLFYKLLYGMGILFKDDILLSSDIRYYLAIAVCDTISREDRDPWPW